MMDPLLTISTEEHNLRTSGQYGLWRAVRCAWPLWDCEQISSPLTIAKKFCVTPSPRASRRRLAVTRVSVSAFRLKGLSGLDPRCDEEESVALTCTGFEAPQPGDYEVSLGSRLNPIPFMLARPSTIIHVE